MVSRVWPHPTSRLASVPYGQQGASPASGELTGMKIISVVAQKGGAGKTTIATNLAVLSERAGHPTVLLDLDPQATAAKWGDKRSGTPPDVVAAQAGRLERLLSDARRQGAGVAILDTAPTAD